MHHLSKVAVSIGLTLVFLNVGVAQFTEVEPNETKAQALANGPLVLANGGTITGTTLSSSTTTPGPASADTFLIQTTPTALQIWQHDLAITTTGTAGHSGSVRGLNQTAGVAGTSDFTAQSSSTTTTPARFNRWYGFGKQEQIFWRCAGGTSTTAAYVATLTSTPITPVSIGTFTAGTLNITTVGQVPASTSDTDLWIYDSNFDAIPNYGNDDELMGPDFRSRLIRPFTPGTYYMALTTFQLVSNQTAPVDDDFRSGTLLDFPNAVLTSSSAPTSATPVPLNYSITDSCGTTAFIVNKPGSYGVLWVCFTVVPAVPPWETNDACAELTLDGLQNTGTSGPISVTKCTGMYTRLYINSTKLGFAWNLFLSSAPAIPAGPTCGLPGIRTPGGQAVNLDFVGAPGSIGSLNGPFWFLTPWAGNIFAPIQLFTPLPPTAGQFLIINPSHPDGYSLSAPAVLSYEAPVSLPAPIAGPTGDDSSLAVSVGCVPFFFSAFTQMHVSTNGRVTFGGADISFTPTALSSTTGVGWFGHWDDLFVSGGPGSNFITIDMLLPNVFRAVYTTVSFLGSPNTLTTELTLNANDGSLTITGLSSLPATQLSNMMIGVCKGGAGGTDPGQTIYALGGPNAPFGPNAAIYSLQSVAAHVTAFTAGAMPINTLRFDVVTFGPNCGGYEWTALP